MLNASEWNNLIPILVMFASPWLAKYGISDGALATELGALGSAVAGAYAFYSAWNMRRVKETAVVTGHAPDVATAIAASVPEAGAGGKSMFTGPGAVKGLAILALLVGATFAWPDGGTTFAWAAGETPTEFNQNGAPVFPAKKAPIAKPPSPAAAAGATTTPAAASGVPCTDLLNWLPIGCVGPNGQTASAVISGPLGDFINFLTSDPIGFDTAAALATQIPALQDGNGQACWIRASSLSAVLKAHPLVLTGRAAPDLEALRLFFAGMDGICEDPTCTQVFTDLTNGIQQLGANITIPSLTQACSHVPNVKLVAPIATPVSAAPAPAAN